MLLHPHCWLDPRFRHIRLSVNRSGRKQARIVVPTGKVLRQSAAATTGEITSPLAITYRPRKPRATVIDPFAAYLRERVKAYRGLTGRRFFREINDLGYSGGYGR